jgi:hypothetical protein
MTAIINGDSPSITFSDGTTQATSAIVSGKVPYTNLPAGSVLQVVQTVKTDTFSTSSTSAVDITGLSVTITPKSATSKILVQYTINSSMENSQLSLFLVRGSTAIFVGDAAGSRVQATTAMCGVLSSFSAAQFNISNMANAITYLDSPATTSATTYKVQCQVNGGTGYINRSWSDDNGNYRARTPSSITVMEIAA